MAAGRAEWVVAGLGNPGQRYADTRHNAGFWVVDRIARRLGARWREEGDRLRAEGEYAGVRLFLVKPLTFMNLSGVAVEAVLREAGLGPDRLIVVNDDMDLPVGRVRVRPGGRAAGHRGVQSVAEHLGTTSFGRVRLGIGRPPGGTDVVTFVLSAPTAEERPKLEAGAERAADVVLAVVELGFDAAMSQYNGME
ncbi:MAG: aminoacyl-tRNA hydrolase [Clostridia bacterium]|nr:aminoacyl-tRNA hydrolase [Clostridia bacterium]